jgi:hypothetical protein
MGELKTYTGGCHCGKVRFEATLDLETVGECNCSICSKRGYVLKFASMNQFKLLSGEDELTDYQFHKKVIHHLFCRTCGVASFARGKGPDGNDGVAVNVRGLDDVDLDTLTIKKYDGRSL